MFSLNYRYRIIMLICLMLLVWVGAVVVNRPGIYRPYGLIRLHIIANSDTPEDQELKRKVRDAIMAELGSRFQAANTLSEARRVVRANLAAMEQIAARTIRTAGKDYPVTARWGYFDFPTKSYGSFVLPAGRYEAVRVVIGEGKGENWWCVLFPPLCFVDISNNLARGTGGELSTPALAGGDWIPEQEGRELQVEWKIKIWEIFKRSHDAVMQLGKKPSD
ncbi:stage II sporulation protein R [Calderihabitans maritimus]|uniref:Stage II sporulation protein R n=1 Tax=Calderihabitans maritimus TaxID=1246530 RepID=A0A1Z5HRI0_9FIRM|nr:stage II sporulation protein R [Calderihabitans maritimus]GAW92133.1 hypothetical protein PTH_0185 [Calderihabitans maritimus]